MLSKAIDCKDIIIGPKMLEILEDADAQNVKRKHTCNVENAALAQDKA